ncbi:hypothetical protein [Cohnella hongkongensis]|uniref:Uncharacterized protein n=1 Tax=Cohnella hongkongensis TaxID=178337 RepID=A0ABV9F9C8_9BACL
MESINGQRPAGRAVKLVLCLIVAIGGIFAPREPRFGANGGHAAAASVNDREDRYAVTAALTRGEQLRVDLAVERLQPDYGGEAYVVVQLMRGNAPILINAVPLKQGDMNIEQRFNVNGPEYTVKIFVFDAFDSELEAPTLLARPVALQ